MWIIALKKAPGISQVDIIIIVLLSLCKSNDSPYVVFGITARFGRLKKTDIRQKVGGSSQEATSALNSDLNNDIKYNYHGRIVNY